MKSSTIKSILLFIGRGSIAIGIISGFISFSIYSQLHILLGFLALAVSIFTGIILSVGVFWMYAILSELEKINNNLSVAKPEINNIGARSTSDDSTKATESAKPVSAATSSSKICGNCGETLTKDSAFCTNCGNPSA